MTGAWLQRVKGLTNVRDLPNTTALFVPANGLRNGMSRGRMVLSQVPFECDYTLEKQANRFVSGAEFLYRIVFS
ncbi:hypothetical protein V6N13_051924 [Hibiscus sabdariffa]|uniref:Uncharacterized protein n=1 Tax=Hibiscus sabdariffa TaxID=183260 RepID=A0ABR2T560_9ROSI